MFTCAFTLLTIIFRQTRLLLYTLLFEEGKQYVAYTHTHRRSFSSPNKTRLPTLEASHTPTSPLDLWRWNTREPPRQSLTFTIECCIYNYLVFWRQVCDYAGDQIIGTVSGFHIFYSIFYHLFSCCCSQSQNLLYAISRKMELNLVGWLCNCQFLTNAWTS